LVHLISLLPATVELPIALLLIASSFLTSAVSATFGLGGGVMMLAILLLAVPPVDAIPIHALIQLGSNGGRAWLMRESVNRSIFLWLLPGSVLGVYIASQWIITVPVGWMSLILAVFILWSVWVPKPAMRLLVSRSWFLVGISTGFITMFLGATGPMLAMFLSPGRYGKVQTVATHAACMAAQHSMKIFAFSVLGVTLLPWLPLLLLMLLSGFVGTWLGGRLLGRLSEQTFRWTFRVLLTVLALRLALVALAGSGFIRPDL